MTHSSIRDSSSKIDLPAKRDNNSYINAIMEETQRLDLKARTNNI